MGLNSILKYNNIEQALEVIFSYFLIILFQLIKWLGSNFCDISYRIIK